MADVHMVFVPTLELWLDDFRRRAAAFPTGERTLDAAVAAGLARDASNVREMLWFSPPAARPVRYRYDPVENVIHLTARVREPLTPGALSELLYDYDPASRGPDTWMLQDIEIVPDEEAEEYGFARVELVPILVRAFVDGRAVDLAALPPPFDWHDFRHGNPEVFGKTAA